MQFLAAASELAIPHYTSATVFAVAKQGNAEVFYRNVKLLAVRPQTAHSVEQIYLYS